MINDFTEGVVEKGLAITMFYQTLNRIERDNLVDWGIILEAWKGLPGCHFKLQTDYIRDFALKEIENSGENISNTLIELFSAGSLEKEEVTELLQDICEEEKINEESSLKKWRLYMLEETLDNLSNDCLYDLIELTDFWCVWGNPENKPHIIQGVDSKMNPTEYYSDNNYKTLIKAHKNWIIQEKKRVINQNNK
jgi:polyhydroxyalkanoate synthesis regulator phasin